MSVAYQSLITFYKYYMYKINHEKLLNVTSLTFFNVGGGGVTDSSRNHFSFKSSLLGWLEYCDDDELAISGILNSPGHIHWSDNHLQDILQSKTNSDKATQECSSISYFP